MVSYDFSYPTRNNPEGDGNATISFALSPPLEASVVRVEFQGIHNSYYLGINEVQFFC
jgi:hypothetical protein